MQLAVLICFTAHGRVAGQTPTRGPHAAVYSFVATQARRTALTWVLPGPFGFVSEGSTKNACKPCSAPEAHPRSSRTVPVTDGLSCMHHTRGRSGGLKVSNLATL